MTPAEQDAYLAQRVRDVERLGVEPQLKRIQWQKEHADFALALLDDDYSDVPPREML